MKNPAPRPDHAPASLQRRIILPEHPGMAVALSKENTMSNQNNHDCRNLSSGSGARRSGSPSRHELPGDPARIWADIRSQATRAVVREPLLIGFYQAAIINQPDLGAALAWLLADKLQTSQLSAATLQGLVNGAHHRDGGLGEALCRDLQAHAARDPAVTSLVIPFLHAKGFLALQAWRISHWLWNDRREDLARLLQGRISEVFGVDIHPAARIGRGVFIDHATSLVIGETATVGDEVSLLHEVTLGGTGKTGGLRHPQVARGVLIGAGAKLLGHIRIGEDSRIGAGSVVLHDVPARCTVVGVPGRVVREHGTGSPALDMDQLGVEEESGELLALR